MSRVNYRYSEAFKRKVVLDMESGRFGGVGEARRFYGITGATTINRWLVKYGKNNLLPKVVRVQMPNEKDEIMKLKREIARLKAALADSHVNEVVGRAYFNVACEKFGVEDVEAFKKKLEEKLSEKLDI